MPYDRDNDTYFWDPFRQRTGSTFARDGSDYDPRVPRPKLSDAYRVLSSHFSPDTLFSVVIVGKLYKGKSEITGYPSMTDLDSLKFTATNIRATGKAQTHGGGGVSLEEKIQHLFGLAEIPERVTGIYFTPFD